MEDNGRNPRMSVTFDDQIFSAQRVGGISRYFVELMRAFRSDEHLGIEVLCPPIWTQNAHVLGAGMGRRLPGQLGKQWRIAGPINRRLRHVPAADVVHHTYYDNRYLQESGQAGLRVVTIYDMIPELFPQLFPRGNPHRDKRAFVDSVDLILCISEATKRDLIDVYGLPAAPIVVTPLGVDPGFRPGAAKPHGLPARYVLYVGSRSAYKDFHVLARAFGIAGLPQDVILVVIGGGRFSAVERESLLRLGIGDRVRRLDLGDGELAGAYSGALCFVFPSRHEGFGLPTLEAMASGCPTILARSSAHPEVGGEAALYFSPGEHDELASVISRVVADPDLRDQHHRAGLERTSKFSWRSTAGLTRSAYRMVRAAHGL